jgi:glyoxylase-like metal-dependent hydrolase (beta-lactamase superfamily II)
VLYLEDLVKRILRLVRKSVALSCIAIGIACCVLIGTRLLWKPQSALASAPEALHIEVFAGDDDSWGVTSTLVYGKTEALLIDGQFRNSQAAKLAARIAATGLRLKAIIITHPDDDHYMGMAVLHDRFPDAPIYMTAAALDEFRQTSGKYLASQKAKAPSETPASLPEPAVLAATLFLIDGEAVEIIKDFQGDVLKPMNSFVWIPSLQTVIAGDIVFNGVHPWLADSTPQTRDAWLHSLQLVSALHPRVVVAGHKGDQAFPDSPEAIEFMRRYLTDFGAAARSSSTADELVAVMKRKYPKLAQEKFLAFAAKAALPSPPASK